MINFHRIKSVTDPFFQKSYTLYVYAFPSAERRSWAELEYELNYEKNFYANALIQDDTFVGLFNYWIFDRFCYIEHVAVVAEMQNKHFGTEAMKAFKEKNYLPIVLEVEMPTDAISIQRIQFYEKLGFTVVSHNYAQPPYEGKGFMLPMQLLSNDHHFAQTHFDLIKETLYDKVYHYETPDS